MKNSFTWLRIVLVLFIILNIIFRYDFGLETFELRWVESGITNWLLAPIIIRLIAFFELLICVLLLFNTTSKKTIFYGLILLLFIYVFDAIVGNSNSMTHSYFLFFYFTPTLSLLALTTFSVIALLIILNAKSTPIIALKKRWQALITVLLWGGVFAMNHLTSDDFKLKKEPYEIGVSEWHLFFDERIKQQPTFDSQHYVVAFFSTHCDVCHWNAMKLTAAIDYYNVSNQLLMVFFEPQEEIEFFLNATKINAPYITLQPSVVGNLVGDGFPAFCEIKDNKVIQEFSPKEFNYAEIHRLFSSN